MSQYIPPVRRKDHARGHSYVDGRGQRIPGVTTIISEGVPKPALVKWAPRVVAETAVNRWDELAELPVATRLKTLVDSPWADRDAAARRGTEVHNLAEQLVAGAEVQVPDELAGHVDAYMKFLEDWDPQPVIVEATIVNYTIGYAGTLDLIADIPRLRKRLLLDVKTNRSGVYGEVALQLSPYRYAEFYVAEDGERPMIPVDGCGVIHVRSDGYSLVPVTAGPAQFRAFRYAMEIGRFVGTSRDLVADELNPTN